MNRTKFIDYDARREPKTSRYCICCQRDIKPGAVARLVYVGESMHAVYPADVGQYIAEHPGLSLGPHLLGMDCANRLGLEWSEPA